MHHNRHTCRALLRHAGRFMLSMLCHTVPCCAGSVHSVHLSHLKPHELRTISRLRFTTHDLEVEPTPPRRPTVRLLRLGVGAVRLLLLLKAVVMGRVKQLVFGSCGGRWGVRVDFPVGGG